MKRQSIYPKAKSGPALLKEMGPMTPEWSAMVRTQIYLSRREHEFVQAQAGERGVPMAAVIRAFIDEKMELPADAWTNNPMLRPTPADPDFNPPEDAAMNHDHYLSGSPKKWVKAKGRWVEAPPLPDDYYTSDRSYAAYHRKVIALAKTR